MSLENTNKKEVLTKFSRNLFSYFKVVFIFKFEGQSFQKIYFNIL